MPPGFVTTDLDLAQILVAAFILFFFGLVLYLRREDKREGYPLKDPAGGADAVGFPALPRPKFFHRPDGTVLAAPAPETPREFSARPLYAVPGAPIVPTGDPLHSGLGPGAFALRRELPLMYNDHTIQVAPMRTLQGWTIVDGDPDPRGMTVIGADGETAGVVRDIWMDHGVKILRYMEVELAGEAGGRVLLPIHHTHIRGKLGQITVKALRGAQFAEVPRTADPDLITAREEDQVNAFYAGGRFFNAEAKKARAS